MHEQIVLGQEAGKEHPMPVFVGQFLGKLLDLLLAARLPLITRLPGAEAIPQLPLRFREMVKGPGSVHRQTLQCGAGSGLCRIACLNDDVFELSAKVES
jgi:hypothetical protein